MAAANNPLWNFGIRNPPGAPRWADLAYADWSNHLYRQAPTKRPPNGLIGIAPTWILIQPNAVSSDTMPLIAYCLASYSLPAVPVFPRYATFPAGSLCYSQLLGTLSSYEIARFLISKRYGLRHSVMASVTLYTTDADPNKPPSMLWWIAPISDEIRALRAENVAAAAVAVQGHPPYHYPHLMEPTFNPAAPPRGPPPPVAGPSHQ